MAKNKTIIGLVGETGSGKDTVANYLHERYGALLLRLADPIKKTLKLYFERFSKEDQAWLAMVFKEHFGKDILHRAVQRDIDVAEGLICINGLRYPEDADFVKRFDAHAILYITAPGRLRWERTSKRGEKTDDEYSLEHFQEFEKVETERHIPAIGTGADHRIENTGTLEALLAQVDQAMEKILEN